MTPLVIALSMLPLVQVLALAQAPGGSDIQAGEATWEAFENDCKFCHGFHGEGGFAKPLAGHRLTPAQFLQVVRQGSGVMPAFVPGKNLDDLQLGQVSAYFASLPRPVQPSTTWQTQIPPLATENQKLAISTGCGQCHGATMSNPRRTAGGAGADYEWFKKEVWEHTSAPGHVNSRHLRMGNYSQQQIPEARLRQLWQFFGVEQGLRVPVDARIGAGVPSAEGVTYTITLSNGGTPGKGLTAEYLTITLPLPTGVVPQQATVVIAKTTGAGFTGIHREPITNTEAAEWEIARLAPGEKQTYTMTLSGKSADAGIPRGMVKWERPRLNSGGTDQVGVSVPRQPR